MARLKDQDWMDTLQDTAQAACAERGEDVVLQYLQEHYGVSSLEELSPSDYDRVLDDLDIMASNS